MHDAEWELRSRLCNDSKNMPTEDALRAGRKNAEHVYASGKTLKQRLFPHRQARIMRGPDGVGGPKRERAGRVSG